MKKTNSVLALLATSLLIPNAFAESELDLAVSADAVAVDYRLRDEVRGSLWGAGAVYNDDAAAWLLSGTFNVVGAAAQTEYVHTGLGLKAVVHDALDTAGAIGLGGSIQYRPPELQGFGLEGQLYYAPSALSVESERYFELYARATYDIHPQARAFVGWSEVSVKYDDPLLRKVDFVNGFTLGFTLSF